MIDPGRTAVVPRRPHDPHRGVGATVVWTTGLDGEAHAFAVEKIFPRPGTVATTAEILAGVTP